MPNPITPIAPSIIEGYMYLATAATKLLDDCVQLAKRYELLIEQLTSDNQQLRTELDEKLKNDRRIELLTRENAMLREQLLSCRDQLNLENGKAVAN